MGRGGKEGGREGGREEIFMHFRLTSSVSILWLLSATDTSCTSKVSSISGSSSFRMTMKISSEVDPEE